MNNEGPAVRECVNFLKACPSSTVLTWSEPLASVAKIHVNDTDQKDHRA